MQPSCHAGAGPKQLLQRPDIRQHLSKLLYAKEWAKSIAQSHPVSEARTVTLAKHWEDVDKIQQALGDVQQDLLPLLQNRQKYNKLMGGTHTSWF